jgi:hypothetical protein
MSTVGLTNISAHSGSMDQDQTSLQPEYARGSSLFGTAYVYGTSDFSPQDLVTLDDFVHVHTAWKWNAIELGMLDLGRELVVGRIESMTAADFAAAIRKADSLDRLTRLSKSDEQLPYYIALQNFALEFGPYALRIHPPGPDHVAELIAIAGLGEHAAFFSRCNADEYREAILAYHDRESDPKFQDIQIRIQQRWAVVDAEAERESQRLHEEAQKYMN